MSWEVLYDSKECATCACGRSIVSRYHRYEGDDFDNYRDIYHDYKIECEECGGKYHIEVQNEFHTYLVPNGQSLNIVTERKRLPFEQFADFPKRVVAIYSKEQLKMVVQEMEEKKYSTRLEDKISLAIVQEHVYCEKSKSLIVILSTLRECVLHYDEYEWTQPKVSAFRDEEDVILQENKKRLEAVLSKSFKIQFE